MFPPGLVFLAGFAVFAMGRLFVFDVETVG
jgi:hypothetical protein